MRPAAPTGGERGAAAAAGRGSRGQPGARSGRHARPTGRAQGCLRRWAGGPPAAAAERSARGQLRARAKQRRDGARCWGSQRRSSAGCCCRPAAAAPLLLLTPAPSLCRILNRRSELEDHAHALDDEAELLQQQLLLSKRHHAGEGREGSCKCRGMLLLALLWQQALPPFRTHPSALRAAQVHQRQLCHRCWAALGAGAAGQCRLSAGAGHHRPGGRARHRLPAVASIHPAGRDGALCVTKSVRQQLLASHLLELADQMFDCRE